MEETKHDKFLRLSGARMEKVEFAMKQLGYLSSHNYEFSEDEAAALVSQLEAKVEDLAATFGVTKTEPAAPPPPVGEAPRLSSQGPLELNREETQHLIRVGPQLDAVLNALRDEKFSEAEDLLTNLMRS